MDLVRAILLAVEEADRPVRAGGRPGGFLSSGILAGNRTYDLMRGAQIMPQKMSHYSKDGR